MLEGWADLPARETSAGVRAGDPIFLSPDYRVDRALSLYVQSSKFRKYEPETKRNYATDIVLLLMFLWDRGKSWPETTGRDLDDYEDWRRFAPENSEQIGGSKWDRELAAFVGLFKWAKAEGLISTNPVAMRQVVTPRGEVVESAEARAKDARPSNVHWLTPRTWRLWVDVGLRGHTCEGIPERGWVGRLEERNVAFVRLLTSSGLRLQEGGSLLTFEIPTMRLPGGRYCHGKVAARVTRSKKERTYYASAGSVGDIESYMASSRAWAIRKAQKAGRYERLPGMKLVIEVTRGLKPKVRWCDQDGVIGERDLNKLTWQERMLLFEEGPNGPEPLWLWLNERGLPFQPHSWENVFRTANKRCERILTPPKHLRRDPHKVYAPYATAHSARHSFALFMLVVLNEVMDRKYGLTPEERRDFRLLYGDPWFMVQGLLGHASRETTVKHYLAPVRNLQLESMLATSEEPVDAPMPDLDRLFARVARDAEGIQDIDTRLTPRADAA
ncbi:integrase [Streptomyces sp. NBC_00154]|uniref:integrase n=1 Tax=Streptomyces sp. NBC_00154 TaxID=2975670 RepID=UPI002253FC9D|nr:integrase [Streptomyces sp. NBC_00154]MCX5310388.1 integrase [Streptomyces sp. NBC_00154]